METVALIMSELATNAVQASIITDAQAVAEGISKDAVVGAQLRAVEASLLVEVYDRTSAVPVRRNPDQDTEGGRGLLLVDVLAKQWNVCRPSACGKIVWA